MFALEKIYESTCSTESVHEGLEAFVTNVIPQNYSTYIVLSINTSVYAENFNTIIKIWPLILVCTNCVLRVSTHGGTSDLL